MRAAILVVLLAFAGCKKKPADDDTTGIGTPTGTPAKMTAPAVPDAVPLVKLSEIGAAYRANEIKADAKYKGKVLRVEMTPTMIIRGKMGSAIIGAYSGFGPDPNDIDCGFVFAKDADDDAANLEKGKPTIIEAKVDGIVSNNGEASLTFRECRAVKK